jgi:hypothetical protein
VPSSKDCIQASVKCSVESPQNPTLTVIWGIGVPSALIIFLFLGYKAWLRSSRTASSRHPQKGSVVDERTQIWRSQNTHSVDSQTPRFTPRENLADAQTQIKPFREENPVDAPTVQNKPFQSENPEDERTELRRSTRGKSASDRTQIRFVEAENPEDERTELRREPNSQVPPEDDRTIL